MMIVNNIVILVAVIAAAAALVYYWRARKPVAALRREGVQTQENLALLRQIDKLILSNMSLGYIAQELVNLLGQTKQMVGASLTTVDEHTGSLTIQAITDNQHLKALSPLVAKLKGLTITPAEVQRGASRTVQAINERRVLSGDRLTDFVSPPLSKETANKIQSLARVHSVYVYPVIVEGRVSGAMTFLFDRTKRDITQKDLDLMQSVTNEVGIAIENARLITQIEEINQKLQVANDHLQQLDASKDEFISIASHQLRTPLTAIKGYVSMLLDGDFGRVSAAQVVVMRQVAHSTNQIINLVNELLSVSRINAQKFELTLVPTRLEEIVRDVVGELQPLAAQKSLRLNVNLPKQPLGELPLDPLRIRQVVLNFIDNAIKYTEHGQIEATLAREGHEVVFTVKDTGIGIPKAEHGQIFTKFYRAENARQMVAAGSGLGLFVAKRVIEGHHGRSILESVEGQGSTFGFRLPLLVDKLTSQPQSSKPTLAGAPR